MSTMTPSPRRSMPRRERGDAAEDDRRVAAPSPRRGCARRRARRRASRAARSSAAATEIPPVSRSGMQSVRRTDAATASTPATRLDRADPADHPRRLLRQARVLAEQRLPGTHGQEVRPEPVERRQEIRPARLGDAEDGHHRGDPDRDPERGQAGPEPSCAEAGAADAGQVDDPDATATGPIRGRRGGRRDATAAARSFGTGDRGSSTPTLGVAAGPADARPLSRSIRPSRISIRRGSIAATSRSWVMTTIVVPSAACSSREEGQQLVRRSPCRGCRSVRRRGRSPGDRPGPGRSRPAAARHPTAGPGDGRSGVRARPAPATPPRPRAAPSPGRPGTAGRRRRCRAPTRRRAGRTAGTRSRSSAARRADSRRSLRPATSCPAIRTVPVVGRSRVPMMWSSVDLPDPDGPTSATSSPASIARSTSRSATTGGEPGYSLPTPASSMTGLTTAPRRCRPPRGRRLVTSTQSAVEQARLDPDQVGRGARSGRIRGGRRRRAFGCVVDHFHRVPAFDEGDQRVHGHRQHVLAGLGHDRHVDGRCVQIGPGFGVGERDRDRAASSRCRPARRMKPRRRGRFRPPNRRQWFRPAARSRRPPRPRAARRRSRRGRR